MKMKKLIIPMILVFCLLISGCGKQETAAESTDGTTQETEAVTTAPEETDAAEETEDVTDSAEDAGETAPESGTEYDVPESAAENGEIDYFTAYQSVFEGYEAIFDGDRMAEDYRSNGIPTQLIYCMGDAPYENIGYALIDLDRDGIQELLIGESSDDPFYDCILLQMYTLKDGEVVKVLSSEEDAWYQLCEDTVIAQTTTEGDVTHYAYSYGNLIEVTSDSPAQEVGYTEFSFYEDFIK
jgi:hypothetical protein